MPSIPLPLYSKPVGSTLELMGESRQYDTLNEGGEIQREGVSYLGPNIRGQEISWLRCPNLCCDSFFATTTTTWARKRMAVYLLPEGASLSLLHHCPSSIGMAIVVYHAVSSGTNEKSQWTSLRWWPELPSCRRSESIPNNTQTRPGLQPDVVVLVQPSWYRFNSY